MYMNLQHVPLLRGWHQRLPFLNSNIFVWLELARCACLVMAFHQVVSLQKVLLVLVLVMNLQDSLYFCPALVLHQVMNLQDALVCTSVSVYGFASNYLFTRCARLSLNGFASTKLSDDAISASPEGAETNWREETNCDAKRNFLWGRIVGRNFKCRLAANAKWRLRAPPSPAFAGKRLMEQKNIWELVDESRCRGKDERRRLKKKYVQRKRRKANLKTEK